MILQRYVLRELIGPVILSVIFFSLMMLLRQLFSLAEILLEARVGMAVFLELGAILTLSMLVLTVPMAALLGCLIGIGRLTAENEILAMRVAGISLRRVFYPVFILAALGSGALMWSGFDFIPNIVRTLVARQTEFQFRILTNLEPGRNYENLSPRGAEVFLYYENRAPAQPGDSPFTLRMEKVALRVFGRTGDLTGANVGSETNAKRGDETLYFSSRGVIQGDLETRSVTLTLEDGIVLPVEREERHREIMLRFDGLTTTLTPEGDIDRFDRLDPRMLTLAELRERIATPPTNPETGEPLPMFYSETRRNLRSEWKAFLNARNEYYQRFSLPFSLLAFVLIAVPLAVELRPKAKTLAFLVALGLILVYYVMLTWAGALGMTYHPWTFAAYIAPNILIGAIGLVLLWRVER
jgi:lipopolysaccharide export LptBFGC system permease protein LptF